MTIALASFRAYGIEAEESVSNKYRQAMEMSITAANTDVTADFGTYAGTFWTAVGATAPGIDALLAIKDIQTRAKTFLGLGGSGLAGYVQADANYVSILKFLSDASAGGAAAEVYVVTGLATSTTDTILSVTPSVGAATGRSSVVVLAGTVGGGAATGTATVTGLTTSGNGDTILAVTQDVKGANNLPLLGYNTQAANALGYVYSADPGASGTIKVTVLRVATADKYVPVSWATQVANALTVTYGADPGAGAKVIVTVSRTGTTAIQAGTYKLAMDGTNAHLPNLLFITGDAPTSYTVMLQWSLKDGEIPVEISG